MKKESTDNKGSDLAIGSFIIEPGFEEAHAKSSLTTERLNSRNESVLPSDLASPIDSRNGHHLWPVVE